MPSGRENGGTGETAAPHGAFVLDDFLPYRLSVAANRVSRALAARYAAHGLSIPEWRVMAVVGGFSPLSSNEVCRRTEMDKAKVSRAVTRLVAAGLLARRPDKIDRRLITLAFTAKGRRTYEAIVPLALELERDLTAALGPGERETLDQALEKIQAGL